MKKGCIALLVALTFVVGSFSQAMAEFPTKPIKLIVYTKPGGAIDVFARKFTTIAAKYTDATFVVVNKSGAGGIVAIKHILSGKSDGYQFAAVTKSNVGKIVSTGNEINVEDLNWMALMVSDPEAVITNRTLPINTWEQIVADAKEKNGTQIWVGPAAGGNDHIMAMKTWNAAGIKATADNALVANRLAAEANAVLIRHRWFDPVGTTGLGLPYQLPPSFVSAKAMQ